MPPPPSDINFSVMPRPYSNFITLDIPSPSRTIRGSDYMYVPISGKIATAFEMNILTFEQYVNTQVSEQSHDY